MVEGIVPWPRLRRMQPRHVPLRWGIFPPTMPHPYQFLVLV
jgi:hypothetical protein